MRKLLAVLLVLFGCLAFVGQATASVSAGYSDCCLNGCKGIAQCASAACQPCAAPQPAPMAERPAVAATGDTTWHAAPAPFAAGPREEPWTPPD